LYICISYRIIDYSFSIITCVYIGIYLPETFKRETKYGLTCLTTTDEGLLKYLHSIQQQVSIWLLTGQIQRLVLVVKGVDTNETLERWQFNITIEDDTTTTTSTENVAPNQQQVQNGSSNDKDGISNNKKQQKSIKEIHNEIQAIIRQITASVTFLPLLQEPCTFDLLIYTNKDIDIVPETWSDSDPCYILNSAEVKLRSFTTSIHQVDSLVAYKEADEWEL
jgi:mitotic spindle assembly checkpoint protein MAD2